MNIVLLEKMGISNSQIDIFKKKIENWGHDFIVYENRDENPTVLFERSKNADILIFSNIPFSNELIDQCSELKMISVGFTGVDHIGMESCKKNGIVVSNAAGYSTTAVAELTIGLILDSLRKISLMHQLNSFGKSRESFLGEELKDKIVGIIGTGEIGSRVAELLLSFGCKVFAFSRTPRKFLIEKGVIYNSFTEVISKSDIVSIHLPLSSETNQLFSKEIIQKMKTGSFLINTARGKIIDNIALSEALKKGHLAGAAVDVYEYEPPLNSDYPLLNIPNIIHTPHIAFATKQSFEKRANIVFENVIKFLEGKPQNVCF